MSFTSDFLLMMVLAYVSLLFIYLSGKLILSFFKFQATKEVKLFSYLVVGLLAWIIIYSIVKSQFLTVNIGLLPVIAFVLYWQRKSFSKFNFELSNIKSDLILTTLIFIPIFIFQASFYFDFFNDTFKTLHTDQYLYADFTNSLKIAGVESKFTDLVYYNDANYLVPYHYAELWLAAFFSKLYGVSSISSYYLIVIPTCVSIFAVGLYSLVSRSDWHYTLKYLLVIGGLFIAGIHFPVYENFEITKHGYQAYDNSILSLFSQKMCLIYIYLLFASILFLNGNKRLGILTFSIIPFFSISFLPCLIGGIIMYSVLLAFYDRKKPNNHRFSLSIALYAGLFIFMFYRTFETSYSKQILGDDVFLKQLISGNFDFNDVKIFIVNNLHRIFRPLIILAPFLVFIWFFLRKNKRLSLLYFCIVLSGVITSSLLFGAIDAYQFASNAYVILNLPIFIGLYLALSGSSSKIVKYSLSILFAVTIMYSFVSAIKNKRVDDSTQDNQILTEIAHKLDQNPTKVLVYLNENDFSSIPLAWWQLKNDLLPLKQYTNKDIIFSIGNPELYFSSNSAITHTDSIYHQFIFPINQDGLTGEANPDFIKKNKIKYLYLRSGVAIPKTVEIDTAFASKAIEGTFYVLK